MVIFGRKRIGQLEAEVKQLKKTIAEIQCTLQDKAQKDKELTQKVADIDLEVKNIIEDGNSQKSAQQIFTEYLFGEEDK